MTFRDRTDAGRLLADALVPAPAPPFVVGAIPRGGVTVALPLVERFRAPLTLVYAGKLPAAVAPEFAFGALDADGEAHVEVESVAMLGLVPADVEEAKARVRGEIERRMAAYGAPSLGAQLPGPGVVLVDDGLATGLTMRVALAYARRHGAREVTVAVPCASAQAAREFERADHPPGARRARGGGAPLSPRGARHVLDAVGGSRPEAPCDRLGRRHDGARRRVVVQAGGARDRPGPGEHRPGAASAAALVGLPDQRRPPRGQRALPARDRVRAAHDRDRKSTRLNSSH